MRDDKQILISQMAEKLRTLQIFHSEPAAVRALTGSFRFSDVALLVDDALAEARQLAVTDIFAGPR
jgi:hypothetical protein